MALPGTPPIPVTMERLQEQITDLNKMREELAIMQARISSLFDHCLAIMGSLQELRDRIVALESDDREDRLSAWFQRVQIQVINMGNRLNRLEARAILRPERQAGHRNLA